MDCYRDSFPVLFIQKIYRYILLCKQRPEPADIRLPAGLGASGNGVALSPLREAGPLTHNNITFLDIVHRPVFHLKLFGDWILSPSSSKTYSVGPNR
jgi:hypothetical protein